MAKEQIKPQFIYLVNGVFRPAELKMPDELYLGYDLGRNVELGQEEISPDALNLVSSVYLGPINIVHIFEGLETVRSENAYQRFREHGHGTVCRIVEMAEEHAKEQGVPYFGVDIVKADKDVTWKFTEREEKLLESIINEKYSLLKVKKLDKPKLLEFVLHPTAQLYVPRK